MCYTIQKEEDPERYGVWFDDNTLLVMLEILKDGTCVLVESKGEHTPDSKLKVLWSGSVKQFLEFFGSESDRLDREKAFDNYIKLYLQKKKN